ncbi:hypothetical protein [Streptomyces chartreusis]
MTGSRTPFARRGLSGGEQVVEDRVAEERAAKVRLAGLDEVDTEVAAGMGPATGVATWAGLEEQVTVGALLAWPRAARLETKGGPLSYGFARTG